MLRSTAWLVGPPGAGGGRRAAPSRLTFSLSVDSWMALGMSRAVFSLVMEQMSFSRTVSWGISDALRRGRDDWAAPARRSALPESPSGRCCCKADPVLREVESSLQEDVPLKSARVVWRTTEKRDDTHRLAHPPL